MKKTLDSVLIALAALSVSCKKDKPVKYPGKLTVDGVARSIHYATIDEDDLPNGYDIYLYFSDTDEDDWMHIMLNGSKHLGKEIDLTKRDEGSFGWYWVVGYYQGVDIYATGNKQSTASDVFSKGTLYSSRLEDEDGSPVMELELKDGVYEGHDISMHFKGKMQLVH